jgi:LuxR family maltose regulon positive regulatory protein
LEGNGRSSTNGPSPTYIQKLLNAFPTPLPPVKDSSPNRLTPRETEILQLLSQGFSYAKMTKKLTITDNTLKTHIKRIYSKLDVHNRVQAVLTAQEIGLL